MPRRPANVTQADIARILRAYRSEGVKVRTRLMPDGSTTFEPIEKNRDEDTAEGTGPEKEIVL